MLWHVKTRDHRTLPILPETRWVFEESRNSRAAGFLFLNKGYTEGEKEPCEKFASARDFSVHLKEIAKQAQEQGAQNEKEVLRVVKKFLRGMGQIPVKRIRQEFMKLITKIGCPELTRAHSLRHLFSTRAQERGMNPFLVEGILGHASLDMTRRYTHFGMPAKRDAVSQMLQEDPVLRAVVDRQGA